MRIFPCPNSSTPILLMWIFSEVPEVSTRAQRAAGNAAKTVILETAGMVQTKDDSSILKI